MPPSDATAAQISALLLARHNLPVSPTWLSAILSTSRTPLPPVPALTSTAHFCLLASDFCTSLSTANPATLLPQDINDPNVQERRLAGNVPVQVLDVEDIGSSKWSQIEGIERVERGEEVRGREVIRTLPVEVGEGTGEGPAPAVPGASVRSTGPHKLLLQDARGTKVVAFEKARVPKLGLADDGFSIGMKVVLRAGSVVRRGVVMLIPESVVVLGGKVEVWDKSWREGRKGRLTRALEREVVPGQ